MTVLSYMSQRSSDVVYGSTSNINTNGEEDYPSELLVRQYERTKSPVNRSLSEENNHKEIETTYSPMSCDRGNCNCESLESNGRSGNTGDTVEPGDVTSSLVDDLKLLNCSTNHVCARYQQKVVSRETYTDDTVIQAAEEREVVDGS